MKKNNLGISLISLIITIIVIIILAAIVIFSGLGTPDSANLAKFTSEFADFNLAVDNAYMKEVEKNALANESRSKKQVYYEIATGIDVVETNEGNVNQVPEATGTVVNLEAQLGKIYPETIEGTEYYTITSDTNVHNWKNQKQYFEETEVHYLTDEGEAFFLPGYLVQEDDGSQKWFINESKYYYGEKQNGAGGVVTPPPQGGDMPQIELNENSAANLLEVGDYVNYVPDSKSYEPDASKLGRVNGSLTTTSATWRVLSVNKVTGEVFLTTELETNRFQTKVFFDINNSIILEADKICKELYSNESLNIIARILTEDDINKAVGYTPTYDINRFAYYAEDEEVEEGSIVDYKGEAYKVCKSTAVWHVMEAKNYKVEGGEETIGWNGIPGITPVKGKPIYETRKNYSYNIDEYNSKLSGVIKAESRLSSYSNALTPYIYTSSEQYEYEGEIQSAYTRINAIGISFDESNIIKNTTYGKALTSTSMLIDMVYIRPAVVLNANTLIDTSDSTRDGKSAEKAWNFKY